MNLNIHRDLNSQWTMGYAKERMLTSPVQAGHGCHSNSRHGSDSRSSTPEGYIHENFTMGIKSPYEYDDQLLDQKMFDVLEAR